MVTLAEIIDIDTDSERGVMAVNFQTDHIEQVIESGLSDLNDLAAETLSIGSATELFETAAGSTVLRNTDGNPINIQLYPSGRAFINDTPTETVIDTQGQWVDIQGPWEYAHMNFLSGSGNGTLAYDGDVTTQVQYQVGGAYSSPSNNAQYEIGLFKDGALKTRTALDFSPPRQDEVLSLPGIFGFTDSTTTGMTHTPRVRCTSGTSNLTIHALSFTLRG